MNLDNLRRHKSITNTGFDNTTGNSAGRILNKNGGTNIRKTGLAFPKHISLFHSLLDLSLPRFLVLGFSFFIFINLIFAWIYYSLGIENLGIANAHTPFEKFIEAFFFSAQTITTVGYGKVSPNSISTGCVASIEAFLGVITFAVLTGLIYGRFSKPRAFLVFSKNALIAPYKEGKGLMLRMASYKNNSLTEVEAEVVASMQTEIEGKMVTNYFPIKLETAKVTTLALNWTLVHAITEDSPIFGFTLEDLENNQFEMLVFVKAFDEHFSNIVKQKTSYHYSELVSNAKFDLMFRQSEDKQHTILELDKIDNYTLL